MKRCICNVAVDGNYPHFQRRLLGTLIDPGKYVDKVMSWTNFYPPGSPTHQDQPYAFKIYALKEAVRLGFTTLLWLDTSVFCVAPVEPLLERIEKVGHFFIVGGDRLGTWSSDAALELFGHTRDQAMEKQLMGGTVYGFDLTNPRTKTFFDRWTWHESQGHFQLGSYFNANVQQPADRPVKPQGFVSDDPRCQGHRYDEVVASFLAYELGMELTWLGDLFQSGKNVVACSSYDINDKRIVS
jgi:hypothetical protein